MKSEDNVVNINDEHNEVWDMLYGKGQKQNDSGDHTQEEEIPTWEKPVPLDVNIVDKLELKCFPKWFADMAKAVADFTETPLELAIMMGLATVATCVQKKIVVMPKPGYYEPLNIWALIMLASGNRKSAVIRLMTQVLTDEEILLAEMMTTEILTAAEHQRGIDDHIEMKRKQRMKEEDATECSKLTASIIKLESEKEPVPIAPQFWTQDVTAEELAVLMSQQGEKMTLLSAEGGIFENMAGRYSGGVPNIDIYLQGHAGDHVRVNRGSRPAIAMNEPTLTMGLCPQPEILNSLSNQKVFRGKGLVARFLYVLPKSLMGERTGEGPPIPPVVTKAYEKNIKALLELKPAKDDKNRDMPHVVRFSEEAETEWKEFSTTIEPQLGESGRLHFMEDWAGKLPGAGARLTGLIHCMEYALNKPQDISASLQTAKKALDFSGSLLSHAERSFSIMGSDEDMNVARKVWGWIKRNRSEEFKARDCFNDIRGTYPKMDMLAPAFDVLAERNYIAMKPGPKKRSAGRPPSQEYIVNPMIVEHW
ncbi:MAG: YfjI family protein [Gammaproteobacteria bacterium]|nr:YfjI family protein [Gammaproteobacteria bacterium]MDX2486195.1 YfjI family protein [Gammaproteobacteria bacterium]